VSFLHTRTVQVLLLFCNTTVTGDIVSHYDKPFSHTSGNQFWICIVQCRWCKWNWFWKMWALQ